MNWSTSSIVLSFPKLIRNVDRLILSSSPIALSTFEGFIIPALQADPFETAKFNLSSFAIKILDLYPGKEILSNPGKLFFVLCLAKGNDFFIFDKKCFSNKFN